MTDNFYQILEIPSDADEREIKRAYHRLARGLHPDKAATPEQTRELEEKFSQVSAAYNTLKDAGKRAEYDEKIGREQQAGANRKTPTAQVLNAGRAAPRAALPNAGAPAAGGKPRQPMGLTPERAQIAQKAYARGMMSMKQGDFPKAVDFFNAAIKNNDNEAVYHAQLAMALMKSHKSGQKAIEAAQRAIDIEPYSMAYKINLAMIFEAIGIDSNARKVYQEILRWEPDNAQVKARLAALKGGKKKGGGGDGPFGLGKFFSKFKK